MAEPINLISLTDPISNRVPIDMALSMAKAQKPQLQRDTIATMRAFADRIDDPAVKQQINYQLNTPDKLFKTDGTLTTDFQNDAKKAITGAVGDKFYTFKRDDGKEYTVVGTGTAEQFTIKAIVPSDGLPKSMMSAGIAYGSNPGFILETLGKVQLAPKNATAKTIDLSNTQDLQKIATEMLKAETVKQFSPAAVPTASPPDPAEDVAPDVAEEIEEDGVSPDAAASSGPPPQPKVGAGTKTLPGNSGFFKKLLNPGAGIGAAIGGLLGFFGLGPIGAIIGALLGGLGASMLTGHNPFEDKQNVVIAPTDKRVQVRTPEGDSPIVEMEMDGPTGAKFNVRGKTNAAGQFEISQAYMQPKVKGVQASRAHIDPQNPIVIPTSADGFVNKEDIYKAFSIVPDYSPAGTTAPAQPSQDAPVADTQKSKDGVAKTVSMLGAKPAADVTTPKGPSDIKSIVSAEHVGGRQDIGKIAIYELKVRTQDGEETFKANVRHGGLYKQTVEKLTDSNGKEFVLNKPLDIEGQFVSSSNVTNGLMNSNELLDALKTGYGPAKVKEAEQPNKNGSALDRYTDLTAPANVKLLKVNGGDPVRNSSGSVVGYQPASLEVEIDNGKQKQKFQLQGGITNDGKKLRVNQIVGFDGQATDTNLKILQLGELKHNKLTGNEFVIDAAMIVSGRNAGDFSAVNQILTNTPKLQRALVDYSGQKAKESVARAEPNLTEGDLSNLVANIGASMKKSGIDRGTV